MTLDEDDEYRGFADRRALRVRIVAWTAIVSLILVGGGATAFSLLFG